MQTKPFVIERRYNAPASKVWDALTINEQMKQWYFNLPGFKPEVGFEFEFTGGPDEGTQYRHLCKVTEVIPGKKIAYTWRYDGYPGNSLVIWELFEEGEQTLLRLTHEGLETLAPGHADFKAENFAEGWTDIIGRSLKEFVEKQAERNNAG
jgi:uncharacterized protein YndB with AHSA1/START domain